MRSARLLTVLGCALALIGAMPACAGQKPPQRRTRPATGARTTPAAATITAASNPLSLCSGAASLVRTIVAAHPPADRAHATRVSGPDTVTFSYQWAKTTARGCRVSVAGSDSAAKNGIVGAADDALLEAGWVAADSLYMADGPDGSMRGFIKADTICLREETWDGGDDSDSTYVPGPDFTLTLTCAPRRTDDHPPA